MTEFTRTLTHTLTTPTSWQSPRPPELPTLPRSQYVQAAPSQTHVPTHSLRPPPLPLPHRPPPSPGILTRLACMALLLKVGRCEALRKMLLCGTSVTRGLDRSSQEGTWGGGGRGGAEAQSTTAPGGVIYVGDGKGFLVGKQGTSRIQLLHIHAQQRTS